MCGKSRRTHQSSFGFLLTSKSSKNKMPLTLPRKMVNAVARSNGYTQGIANALLNLGSLARDLGDPATARVRYEESLAIARSLGDTRSIGNALNNLGILYSDTERNALAQQAYEEALTIRQQLFAAHPLVMEYAVKLGGTYGNLGRNTIQGPGLVRLDMGLTRTFRVRENHSVEFRAEAFNLPNHVIPADPNVSLNSGNFGKILNYRAAYSPRVMQLALKYVF